MDPRIVMIDKRLKGVKRIIPVVSGKGGVGKSLIASASSLILNKRGFKVGLLDLDFYGPTSHVVLGVDDYTFPEEDYGILPRNVNGIDFMSLVFYAKNRPIPFRGSDVSNAMIELLTVTRWNDLDFLIIDMPPGMGEEVLDMIRLVRRGEFLVVTTPSKMAIETVKRLLILLKEVGVKILGVLENMRFKDNELVIDCAKSMGVPYLGSITFDFELEESIGNVEKMSKSKFWGELSKILGTIVS
ncbi:MAG: ATP-binding protein [Candidatus Asgardarchaeia archaeon]